jgi:hypothetical protein
MKLAYHSKNDNHGWHHVITASIDAPSWNEYDIWAYNHMMQTGEQVVTLGWNMWQLVNDIEVTE